MDWNPVAAAEAQSAFMAVLAGFVFVGLVYLLTEGRRRHAGETFMLFLASFVCLAAGSYIATIVSGEVTCRRAWSESSISSGMVAVGVVAMLSALAWLLPEQYGEKKVVRRFTFACVLLLAIVVVELLTTSARGYLLDVPGWQRSRVWVAWYFPVVVVVLVGAFAARHIRGGTDASQVASRQQRRAGVAAASVVVFALLNLAVIGPVGDRPADLWARPAAWVVAVSVFVPLGGAVVALGLLMWALPTGETWGTTAGQSTDADQDDRDQLASGGVPIKDGDDIRSFVVPAAVVRPRVQQPSTATPATEPADKGPEEVV
ncbi:hypothetical protein [Micromonospora sp. DT47]|uniref:hypothetical protein n=1 Tax=Micromonospora sp. DT47 TaxID=3393431 RepID=UPI003CF3978C